MIAQMHNAGVLHGDLHSGNLLIRTDTPTPQPVLMDLHRMTKRPYLSRRAKAKNLALLFHDRFGWTTRTERLRFLKHYLLASRIGGTLRGWQIMVTDFAWRHRQKLYAKRARRVVGNNRYFHRLRLNNGWRGHAVLESKRCMPFSSAAHWAFTPDQWESLLSDPLKLLEEPYDRLIKHSGSGVVLRKKITVGGHVLDVVIKNPRRKKSWKILLDCFRPSRPMRAFKLGHALLTRNIPTALPLVVLERKIGPLLLDSILITEYVPSQPLPNFLHHWLGLHSSEIPSLDKSERRRLAQHVIWQMGRLLQHLHDNRYHHRDLKGSNMLVYWSQQAPPEIVLIDLDGLKYVRHLTEKQRFQGLMRLNVSLLSCPPVNSPGQLRMLLGYLRRPGSGKINFKPYWRVLENWSQKKLGYQIRSLRKKQKAVRK
jgi:tRNA A-37 threonylcarbamoyl transferase component Bud32